MLLSSNFLISILLPKPSLASSIEFESISNIECLQPSRPSEPNITDGLFRTRSAPLRDVILSLL